MTKNSYQRQITGLLAWIAVSFIAASVGALASINAREFYQTLIRPVWAPPGYLFGPVWTLLYLLMGISAWRIWAHFGFRSSGVALWLFLIQLILNALWSWLFFQWHLGAWSCIEIVILWFFILATIINFWRLNPMSGALLLPYLAWVTFATALAFTIWRLNPHHLV